MQPQTPKQPTGLFQALEYFNTINVESSESYGANITVDALRRHGLGDREEYRGDRYIGGDLADMVAAQAATTKHSNLISKIESAFAKWNVKKFVPLITRSMEANVAVAMYAGDGIVAKITKATEFSGARPMPGVYTPLPGVLPPIASVNVDGYVVEVFPWVNTKNIDQRDVEKMSAFLAERNMKFYEKDAKPNNIGKLPNGDLVVLDGNAVTVLDNSKPVPTHATNAWQDLVYKQFTPLYEMKDLSKLVSDNPNFAMTYSPLMAKYKPEMKDVTDSRKVEGVAPGQVPEGVKRRFNWFGFGRGGSSGGGNAE